MEFGNYQQNINIGKCIQFDPIYTLKTEIILPRFNRNISQLKQLLIVKEQKKKSETGLSGVKYLSSLVTTLLFYIFKVFFATFGAVLRLFNAFASFSCELFRFDFAQNLNFCKI